MKPLQGSRGDFAQRLHDEASLVRYMREVSQYYDGDPYPADRRRASSTGYFCSMTRWFTAPGKHPPFVEGDGVRSIRYFFLAAHNAALRAKGLSPASIDSVNTVLPKGKRFDIPGRMN